jgi:glycerol-3-phosphate acyltransferase PlsX
MAAAAIIIGRVPGVLRPSIASVFPTPGSPTLVLDSGANPDVKPEHLVQFAQMGAVAAEALFGITNPRVALLSIGEEKSKGRHLEREANRLLGATSLNFVGNVEGRDVATDSTDVIVTDGFTGNVFLKSVEGTAQMVMGLAVEALSKLEPDVRERAMGALKEVRAMLDYETYGGAQLLGVRGVVVICHGSSTRVAIANALQLASDAVDHELPERLAAAISG